jgi:predicted metal-dependent HD superfamily phosphohydrolase
LWPLNADRFLAALPPGTDPVAATAVGAGLLERWNEPHRYYHTGRHLSAMLSVVDLHGDLAADAAQVRLAVWFHDAIYDPQAGDNEEASAALAARTLTDLGVDPSEAVRLVLLTAGHDPDPADRNGLLMADADLAILAADPEVYDEYAAAVRLEYRHVPDEQFRVGRAGVLATFLQRRELFRVVPDRAAWTAQAHGNIRRELESAAEEQNG